MEEDKKSDQVEISQSKSKILSKKNDSLQPKSHSILLSHKLYFVEKSSLIWSFLCEFGNKTTNLIYEIEIAGQRRILCTLCSGPKEVVENKLGCRLKCMTSHLTKCSRCERYAEIGKTMATQDLIFYDN